MDLKGWFYDEIFVQVVFATVFHLGGAKISEIIKVAAENKIIAKNPELTIFSRLKIKDLKSVAGRIEFDRKIFRDYLLIESEDMLKDLERYQQKMPKARPKQPKCVITGERIKNAAFLFDCIHTVDLQVIKSSFEYPEDYICRKCGFKIAHSKFIFLTH